MVLANSEFALFKLSMLAEIQGKINSESNTANHFFKAELT